MSDTRRVIVKSKGVTRTEVFLSQLCERTFLKLWSFPNPFKSDGKELCDLLVVFDRHAFLFFDRESRIFETSESDVNVIWKRWKKNVIEKQIKTADGAQKYITQHPDDIYLDQTCEVRLPVQLPHNEFIVHKIIVAHGAEEACKRDSIDNIVGSLAVSYSDGTSEWPFRFCVPLERSDPVHLLDSHNIEILLGELDTAYDFTTYIVAKEEAIQRYDTIVYCGEEDLLAHYFGNFDKKANKHFIGTTDRDVNALMIGEGEWQGFRASAPYRRKKIADKKSYLWDEIIQRTADNAFEQKLLGDCDAFSIASPIFEMAKEPRFWRRYLVERITYAIQSFPYHVDGIARYVSFMQSFYPNVGYVFLQIKFPESVSASLDTDYRQVRQNILKIACGAAKNKWTHLTTIIGIAIDAPKGKTQTPEDFVLLNAREWPDDIAKHYAELNRGFKFFETGKIQISKRRVSNFPPKSAVLKRPKTGRNEKCPCGSGQKFKNCHGRS